MKGRTKEVLEILKSGAKINGNSLPPDNEMLELLDQVGRKVSATCKPAVEGNNR